MMKANSIAVLADSCNDIPQELLDKYHIYTLPLMINYKDASYRDRVDITPEQVYERFQEEIPKTSLPLPETIADTFAKIKADGFDQVIVSAISSGLSGTCQAIKLLAEDIQDMQIVVIDTLNIAIASGFVALYRCRADRSGTSVRGSRFENTSSREKVHHPVRGRHLGVPDERRPHR